MSTGPTDWVSGERVFAPPTGTVDVDWLVPAVLEAVPSAAPTDARAALAAAWTARRAGTAAPAGDPLARAAGAVVEDAVTLFRAAPAAGDSAG
ncbi:hypothetical protein [Cellulomonas cellasea]|uniref:Uncharacterized protein n=1 Tax=Cellulomonas cellasea TaxID=43670 RepID=A0A7W4UG04_9CELL|nr:hypothetical protein [Cellulomonas cellasea]MBB2923506.1 hypothetical protein [Cellulomonas cellasea]